MGGFGSFILIPFSLFVFTMADFSVGSYGSNGRSLEFLVKLRRDVAGKPLVCMLLSNIAHRLGAL